jgi:hypothetical protein
MPAEIVCRLEELLVTLPFTQKVLPESVKAAASEAKARLLKTLPLVKVLVTLVRVDPASTMSWYIPEPAAAVGATSPAQLAAVGKLELTVEPPSQVYVAALAGLAERIARLPTTIQAV